MNIDPNVIRHVVNTVRADLIDYLSVADICLYKSHSLTKGYRNYNDSLFQMLYILKYWPAYYFEYSILAYQLNNRLRNDSFKQLNILSLGCGAIPDFFSLKCNLDNDFTYKGYDAGNWRESIGIFLSDSDYVDDLFINDTISSDRCINDIKNADVYIFPKSIGDIGDNVLDDFIEALELTEKKHLFFLNSYINNKFDSANISHINKFQQVHDKLLSMGFKTDDKNCSCYYRVAERKGLVALHENFQYPEPDKLGNEIKKLSKLDGINCNDCSEACIFMEFPILTNQFIDYNLLEYIRV